MIPFIYNSRKGTTGWNGCMASLTQWTWVWASSGRWWCTEKPGMLQSMGLQRVWHDWVIELNWTELPSLVLFMNPCGLKLMSSIFLGSKITADGDCNHEIKRCLVLGRKAVTNLVQFSSVTPSCPTLCDPMNCSTPGLPVHHQLPEFVQTHVHWVGDAIQPSHPLLSPFPPAPNPSQHQSLFQWVNSSQVLESTLCMYSGKVLEFQL